MKNVTVYEANDGERFDTEVECLKRDRELEAIEQAMSGLIPPVAHKDFELGKAYIAHNKARVELALRQLNSLLPTDFQLPQEDIFRYRNSMVYRYLTDNDEYKHFAKAWRRFTCMDSNYKEWAQFADALRSDGLL